MTTVLQIPVAVNKNSVAEHRHVRSTKNFLGLYRLGYSKRIEGASVK